MSDTTTLLDGTEVKVSREPGSSFTVETFSLMGDRHMAAVIDATIYDYADVTGRTAPTDDDLRALIGKPISLSQYAEGAYGAGRIQAREGKIFQGQRGLAILPKGKRNNGFMLQNVLDVEPGYNKIPVLQKRINTVRARFPQTEALTQERLNALPERSNTCTLAVFGTARMPDEQSPGAIWLISNYLREDDIIEGVLLIRGEHGTSEYGSIYGEQLLKVGGAVKNFGTCTYGEAVEMTDLDYFDALAAVMARTS